MNDLTLLAAPRATAAQCTQFLCARPHGAYTDADIAQVIVPAYGAQATAIGLDPAIAIAQLIHETGNLTSWWAQRPRRNPAGLGVSGASALLRPTDGAWQYNPATARWHAGLAFASWADHAIPAHLGRLLAYALRDDQADATQRALIQVALRVRPLPDASRGAAPTLAGLAGRWAVPGTTYPAALADLVARIAAIAEVAPDAHH